ncbi:hypothetical protein BJY01DRAFT_117093 [Aspergillus pseudoustus]|uniref:Hypervirulence associated protein TUDOR domain-containing protein n=1 Tax=Aspergillus pseudoustus TaxID=1810923 RepID=A0ABR4KGV6_9EURO
METLTHAVQNASTAASNAIWGTDEHQQPQSERTEQIVAARHGEEPLSGVQGKGTATDPFDAGNRAEQPTTTQSQKTEQIVAARHGDEPISGVQGRGTVSDPYDGGNRYEQPGASRSIENTAVVTEPLSSIGLAGTHTYPHKTSTNTTGVAAKGSDPTDVKPQTQTQTRTQTDKPSTDRASLATSPLGTKNPAITHPEPVDSPQKTPYTTSSAAPTTGALGAGAGGVPVGQPSTTDSTTNAHNSSTSGSAAGLGSTTSRPSEQRKQEGKNTEEGESSGANIVDAAAHKQKVSKEALRGPSVSEPRDRWEKEEKEEERLAKQDEQGTQPGEPKTTKAEGGGSSDKNHSKDTKGTKGEEHHHKSMKERLHNIVHPHHH